MLLPVEPVEIFHQFVFFILVQFKNIPFWKLLRIVLNRFVDVSCFHAVQFSDIAVEDYLLVAQGDLYICRDAIHRVSTDNRLKAANILRPEGTTSS